MKTKQSILIVDDEPRNLRILEEILGEDFELMIANSGDQALEMLNKECPDLVLLDIMMPGINGYEVCKKIRNNPALKFAHVILVSGKAMVEERLEGYRAGADDYITKPFVPEELYAKALVFLKLTKVERELDSLNSDLEAKVKLRSEQLSKAERAAFIGMHTAEIAHDMNNPLAVINLNMSLLEAKYPGEKKLETVNKSVEKIISIIRSILQASREDNDHKTSDFCINDVIESELKLFELDSFFQKQVKVEKNLQQLPYFRGQVSHFSRCIGNLIKNAVDSLHGRDKKNLKISTSLLNKDIIIKIEDSGGGIAPENLEKIFDPFFTTKPIKSKDGGPTGTGLGLPSVKRMLEGYGGKIEFSSNLEVGTLVTINLPLSDRAN